VQEVMYQYLLEQRPDLVAKLGDQQTNMQNFNDGKYLPTFEAQISCVTNSSHYAKLKTQMENSVAGFKKDWTDKQSHLHIFLQYHPFLKDILSGLYDSIIAIEKGGSVGKKILNAAGDAIAMPFTEALGLSSPASDASQLRDDVSSDHLTQKGDETFEIAVTEYRAVLEAWKLAVLIMKIISVAGVVESAIEEEGSKLVTTPDKVESWFDKLDKVKEYSGAEITIEHAIHAAYLVSMLNDKRLKDWHVPAMGYQPLDKLPRTLKAKLNYVDQTKWLYQHSGMRIPSKDLMNNIYIPYVIDAMQGFGKYPKA
jgi:hypothetical protein